MALPKISLKFELGGGRVGQAMRLRCDSAGDYLHIAQVLLHTHLGKCFPLCHYAQTLLNTEQIQGVKYQGTPGVLHSLRSHLSNGVHLCSADASELHCIIEFCCCR